MWKIIISFSFNLQLMKLEPTTEQNENSVKLMQKKNETFCV